MKLFTLLAFLPMAHAAASWYTALAPNGRMYYYNDAGKTTWERPSELLGSVVPQPKRTEGDEAAFEDYPIGYVSPVRKSPPRKSVGQEWRELFSSIGDTLKQMREAKPARPAVLVAKASLLGGVYGMAVAVL